MSAMAIYRHIKLERFVALKFLPNNVAKVTTSFPS
jgi:hypothetical protein